MRWSIGKQYKIEDNMDEDYRVENFKEEEFEKHFYEIKRKKRYVEEMSYPSMTVMKTGEVIIMVNRSEQGTTYYEARQYAGEQTKLPSVNTVLGHLKPDEHFLLFPSVLAITVDGEQHVALSCYFSQCIWLARPGAEAWSVAWKAIGVEGSEERAGQPKPGVTCLGKPGQIIAANGHRGEGQSVSVFDITQIPFRVVAPEIKVGMIARMLCYCDLGVDGGLAITDHRQGKLCMFSLESKKLLWGVGGQGVKVAGAEWEPRGVCTDNRGRIFVGDSKYSRVFVFSASSGSMLQVMQGSLLGWRTYHGRVYETRPGIELFGPDLIMEPIYRESLRCTGSRLQYFEEMLGSCYNICWHEQTKSIIVHNAIKHLEGRDNLPAFEEFELLNPNRIFLIHYLTFYQVS